MLLFTEFTASILSAVLLLSFSSLFRCDYTLALCPVLGLISLLFLFLICFSWHLLWLTDHCKCYYNMLCSVPFFSLSPFILVSLWLPLTLDNLIWQQRTLATKQCLKEWDSKKSWSLQLMVIRLKFTLNSQRRGFVYAQ